MNIADLDAILFALPIVVGGLLIFLARWAQKKNLKLIKNDRVIQSSDGWAAFISGDFARAAQYWFLGDGPRTASRIGRLLMIFVIVIVLAALFVIVIGLSMSRR